VLGSRCYDDESVGLRARFGRLGDGDMERVSCAVRRSKDALATWAYNRISHSNTSQHELDSCLRKLGVTCGIGF
jgi:hypothetical protein